MGVAQILAENREELPGTVVFLFQPAEEGPPAGEDGGAELMLREGAFDDPRPEAVFGLHVLPFEVGTLGYAPRGAMAAADGLRVVIRGRQTHGAQPWAGVDPVLVASQVVVGLQSVVSRQLNITDAPAIVTIATIHGGVRGNIIPDSVVMEGTIRTLDNGMRDQVDALVRRTAQNIAAGFGAEAEVRISRGYPVTYNDPTLLQEMLPAMRWASGAEKVMEVPPITGAEDFSYLAMEAPGVFLFLGGRPEDVPAEEAPPNHSPYFFVDEGALKVGVRALAGMTVDYMERVGAGGTR
jgi:amidohydrolase